MHKEFLSTFFYFKVTEWLIYLYLKNLHGGGGGGQPEYFFK